MKIKEIFEQKKVVFSFEVFPPKGGVAIEKIYDTIEEISSLGGDYISVTYGAGGSSRDNKTCEVSSLIKNKHEIEALSHLTCINSTKDNLDQIINQLKDNNIENILALRGDMPNNEEVYGDFKYAYELINYLKEKGDFGIASACYPEGHFQCENIDEDIKRLKEKVDSGVDYLITQLFLDNNIFYNYIDKLNKNRIYVPIEAGIMPVINKKQIETINTLCGATIPDKFIKIINKYEQNKEALRDAGIAYAVEQIVDLLSSGVKGIHLYTMNNPYVAKKIVENISSILKSLNE